MNPNSSAPNKLKQVSQIILSIFMIIAGTLHFITPQPFVRIVPDYLPYHLGLVYISGFFEIIFGMGLLIPSLSRAAAWSLILLFIAVFPANINQAVNNIAIEGIPHNQLLYWLRLPLQAVLIAWAWWFTREQKQQADLSNLSVQDKNSNA